MGRVQSLLEERKVDNIILKHLESNKVKRIQKKRERLRRNKRKWGW